jgi:hypothetical protein
MKVGLWSDSHNFPNIVLMKLSAYYKARGDHIDLLNHLNTYDLVYCSKVFDFTPDAEDAAMIRADKIIRAGTGYHNYTDNLPPEIEHFYPDYGLYPQYHQAYGYLTRGCPRGCPFCIVAPKEGKKSVHVADLSEFWHGQKEIKLLDPNLLACREHEILLKQLANSGAWVDFTQGLDIRMLTDANVDLIGKIKVKMLHFAWDNPEDNLTKQFEFFKAHTTLDWRKLRVYVLVNFSSTHDQDLYRIYRLREFGFDPYVMIFDKLHANEQTKQLARWVNNKFIFRECERFEDYNSKKG